MKCLSVAGGLLSALAGLGLLGSTALAAAPPAHSLVPHAGATINISFDGFCDGLAISSSGVDAAGLNALPTGCSTGGWTEFGFMGGGGGMTNAFIATQGSGLPFFYVINANHTWAGYYDTGGGTAFEYNSGTWSFGVPADAPAKAGVRSSGPSASLGAFASHPQPLFTTNIHFNGFCDGMQLNVPGAAGTPSLDGVQTGCGSDTLIGAYSSTVAGVFDSVLGVDVMWMITPDGNFTVYGQNEDGTEYIVNSGTWGLGVPPPEAPQLKLFPSAGLHTR